jgi:hypothetical protein
MTSLDLEELDRLYAEATDILKKRIGRPGADLVAVGEFDRAIRVTLPSLLRGYPALSARVRELKRENLRLAESEYRADNHSKAAARHCHELRTERDAARAQLAEVTRELVSERDTLRAKLREFREAVENMDPPVQQYGRPIGIIASETVMRLIRESSFLNLKRELLDRFPADEPEEEKSSDSLRTQLTEVTRERDSARRGQIACGEKMGELDLEYKKRVTEFDRVTAMLCEDHLRASKLQSALSSCRRVTKSPKMTDAEKLQHIERIATEAAPPSILREE